MNIKKIFTERSAREEFKDKLEVFMAVVVLSSYAYKKYKESQETPEILESNQEQE